MPKVAQAGAGLAGKFGGVAEELLETPPGCRPGLRSATPPRSCCCPGWRWPAWTCALAGGGRVGLELSGERAKAVAGVPRAHVNVLVGAGADTSQLSLYQRPRNRRRRADTSAGTSAGGGSWLIRTHRPLRHRRRRSAAHRRPRCRRPGCRSATRRRSRRPAGGHPGFALAARGGRIGLNCRSPATVGVIALGIDARAAAVLAVGALMTTRRSRRRRPPRRVRNWLLAVAVLTRTCCCCPSAPGCRRCRSAGHTPRSRCRPGRWNTQVTT